MSALRNYLNKIKPNFEADGKPHAFRGVFHGFETFLSVPNQTAKTGVKAYHEHGRHSVDASHAFWNV